MNEPRVFAGLRLDRPRLMGVVNVTPDSFSDGGDYLDPGIAVAHGLEMREAGADIIDVGGESTRPGSEPVDEETEKARVLPVVGGLAEAGVLVSVDTRRAAVMAAAIDAGARIVNDVTALAGDPESVAVCARAGVDVVLMHMQGEPRTMQENPTYDDPAKDIFRFFEGRIHALESAGIGRDRIAVDPGIGFGKNLEHNLRLLSRIDCFHQLGVPVLLGASRKSFISKIDRDLPAKQRVGGSVAAAIAAWDRGVQMFRVHDVAATRQALAVWSAVENAEDTEGT